MILNLDCVRDILLTVEAQEYPCDLTFKDFSVLLSSYTPNELTYACLKLREGNLLQVKSSKPMNSAELIIRINDLTYEGHEFLNNVKNDNVWSKTKELATATGSLSLKNLSTIATNIISAIIKNKIGLT